MGITEFISFKVRSLVSTRAWLMPLEGLQWPPLLVGLARRWWIVLWPIWSVPGEPSSKFLATAYRRSGIRTHLLLQSLTGIKRVNCYDYSFLVAVICDWNHWIHLFLCQISTMTFAFWRLRMYFRVGEEMMNQDPSVGYLVSPPKMFLSLTHRG